MTISRVEDIQQLSSWIQGADAILVGAGSGLSTSAGFQYSGERFRKYFGDFEKRYHFHDMYTGGFYAFPSLEEQWAYWSRFIYLNRYCNPPKNVYETLRKILAGKDYFILTTNVDHCFQKAGFDKKRLFYTQGDYGLFQCSIPCHDKTYDNRKAIENMLIAQGYQLGDSDLLIPEGTEIQNRIPSEAIPYCPICHKPMAMNLRADGTFIEDAGWKEACQRYLGFRSRYEKGRILFLELGVGANTPGIIKYPFWQMTFQNPQAHYVSINKGEAYAPKEIADRSLCLDADIGEILEQLRLV